MVTLNFFCDLVWIEDCDTRCQKSYPNLRRDIAQRAQSRAHEEPSKYFVPVWKAAIHLHGKCLSSATSCKISNQKTRKYATQRTR